MNMMQWNPTTRKVEPAPIPVQPHYGTTKAEAERLASQMDSHFMGCPAGFSPPNSNRIVTGHEVSLHDYMLDRWGVVQRWRYADLDIAVRFGGEFMPIQVMHRMISQAEQKLKDEKRRARQSAALQEHIDRVCEEAQMKRVEKAIANITPKPITFWDRLFNRTPRSICQECKATVTHDETHRLIQGHRHDLNQEGKVCQTAETLRIYTFDEKAKRIIRQQLQARGSDQPTATPPSPTHSPPAAREQPDPS